MRYGVRWNDLLIMWVEIGVLVWWMEILLVVGIVVFSFMVIE